MVTCLHSGAEELDDLELDPEERHSIHELRPELVAEARRVLELDEARASTLRLTLGLDPDNHLSLDAFALERLEALGYVPPLEAISE